MKYFDWDAAKNEQLKNERGIGFEDILLAVEAGRTLDDIRNPNIARYVHQRELVIDIDGYAYLVPYVETAEKIFLKTIIPSRKATKKYIIDKLKRKS